MIEIDVANVGQASADCPHHRGSPSCLKDIEQAAKLAVVEGVIAALKRIGEEYYAEAWTGHMVAGELPLYEALAARLRG